MTSAAHRHTIGLSDPDLQELLDKLEGTLLRMDGDGRRSRQDERILWHHRDVLVRAVHSDGGRAEYVVAMHDLSRSGAAFVHSGFLHEGTPLEIDLPLTSPGRTERVGARVVWCWFLTRSLHVSGVRFDQPIEPQNFIEPS